MNRLMKFFFLPGFLTAGMCHILMAQLPVDSLKAYYNFNGSVEDVSGEGNHLVQFSGDYTTDRFGNENSAWFFDGVNDSLAFPLTSFAPIAGDFTISLWYRTHSPKVMSVFSSREFANDTTGNFEIELNSNNLFYLQNIPSIWYQTYMRWNGTGNSGNAIAEGSAGVYIKGEWCMLVVQREVDTLRIYRNHVLHSPGITSLCAGALGDTLDMVMSAFPNRFEGAVDDLRFYNRALTQTEIDLLWFENQAFVFMGPKPTDAFEQGMNVVAWWQYDETQVSDSINVEYRIDSGPWQPAVHSHLAYEYYAYVDMNLPAGTGVEVRVTDVANPALTASSGTFIVSPYHWVEVNDSLPFTARDGSGLLNYDGKMWLLGGWDPPNHPPNYTHNEIWSSTDGDIWTYEGDAPWSGRHVSGWMVYNDAMWLVGSDPQAGCLSDVWRSNDGINWELILDTIPGYLPRYDACYAPMDDRMLMFGGERCGIEWPGEGLSETWSSADGASWEQLPDAPWFGRGMQLNWCVDDEGYAWFLGGSNDADRRSYNEVWKTSDGTDWTLVNEAAPWTGRYWHTVSWYDGKIWLLSGMATGNEMGDAWYSEDGVDWHQFISTPENSPYGTRHAHSTTVYDNALWYMCGMATNSSWKIVNSETTGIPVHANARSTALRVFPNPVDDLATLWCDSMMIGKTFVICDYSGSIIYSGRFTSQQSLLPMNGVAAGFYIILTEGCHSTKLIVH